MSEDKSDHQQAKEYFYEKFERHQVGKYVPNYAKDGAHIKKLLNDLGGLKPLKAKIDMFFNNPPKYVTDANEGAGCFTIGMFVTQINNLHPKKKVGDANVPL